MSKNTAVTSTRPNLFHVVLRHRKKGLAVFFATIILATVGVLFWPRTYLSEARLFVRIGHETIALDPTVTAGRTLGVRAAQQTEISTVVELHNRQRLETKAKLRDLKNTNVVATVEGQYELLESQKAHIITEDS